MGKKLNKAALLVDAHRSAHAAKSRAVVAMEAYPEDVVRLPQAHISNRIEQDGSRSLMYAHSHEEIDEFFDHINGNCPGHPAASANRRKAVHDELDADLAKLKEVRTACDYYKAQTLEEKTGRAELTALRKLVRYRPATLSEGATICRYIAARDSRVQVPNWALSVLVRTIGRGR